MIKYPYQVGSIKRPEKVLGLDAKLSAERCDDPQRNGAPLELHAGYSRFVLTIVDKAQNCQPTANIPAKDLPAVLQKSKIALYKLANKEQKAPPAAAANQGLAFSERLSFGKFKGKTPAEVLAIDVKNEEQLLYVASILSQNVGKYPANKKVIDAINEAISLAKEGKLGASSVPISTEPYKIYESGYKFKTIMNAKGYNLIYSLNVTFDESMRYPITVEVQNCFAPVETVAGGQKNIQMQKAEDVKKASMVLSADEWFELVSSANAIKCNFEAMIFRHQLKIAEVANKAIQASFAAHE